MTANQDLAATLKAVVRPGMKRKAVIEAVRERHPKASKKAIARAAFYALTDEAAPEPAQADALHDFALSERVGADDVPDPVGRGVDIR